MSKLLVTGGAGFIGANFVHYWAGAHPDDLVIVLDALTYAGNRASLVPLDGRDNFRFVHGNILDKDLVSGLLRDERIDTVVHFAAESHVDRSILGPAAFVDTNVVGTHNLLQAARAAWLDADDAPASHRFHHVSTDEVYGSLAAGEAAFSETTPYAPNSPYAASKAASDHLVRAYRETYGLRTSLSNCSNNYGPYQFPEKLIPLMILNALSGKPLPVYGDGSNIRDWLYVEDHVRAIELILASDGVGQCYNVGGNEEHANLDIVRRLCGGVDAAFRERPELAQRFPNAPAANGIATESLLTFVKDRPGHDWRYAIDASLIKSDLGFVPRYDFESGLMRTIKWMLDNEPWWRAVTDGSYREWIDAQYSAG